MEELRRRSDQITIRERMSNVGIFIWGAVFICSITVIIVAITAIMRPDNASVIATIIGLTTPITTALMAAGLHGIYKGVDGRFTQLLDKTALLSKTQGRAEVIKGLYTQLKTLDPNSPEYAKLQEQLKIESEAHFGIITS